MKKEKNKIEFESMSILLAASCEASQNCYKLLDVRISAKRELRTELRALLSRITVVDEKQTALRLWVVSHRVFN